MPNRMFGLGSFWPWMASKSRSVIKAINYLDKKVIRWPVFLPPFSSGKKKMVADRAKKTVNKYQTDWTSKKTKHRQIRFA